jgi:protocatechuate 3,4-dioxygenase, alpha subunit
MGNDSSGKPYLPTVSQTVGPFFHIGLDWLFGEAIAKADAPGRHIAIEGRVLDGAGVPIPDAVLELWQADANGRYAHPDDPSQTPTTPDFGGFARVPTSASGQFRFTTVKPGRVPAPGGGLQAPHILVALFMRGLLRQAVTRIYFSDEPSNDEDLVLGRVPASRRSTLLARARPGDSEVFDWNIILQGPDETVFFDY